MNRTYLVLPAAGDGQRMGSAANGRSKVMLDLKDGLSVLELTLRAFAESGVLDGVVTAVRPGDSLEIGALCRKVMPDSDILVVSGGDTRQESVYKALLAIEDRAEFVLVHDAARPLCPVPLIKRAAECCFEHRACLLAVPLKPTLKSVVDGAVKETVCRARFWEAQTPQAFSYSLLKAAHERAIEDGLLGTDDSQLVEHLGYPVRIVEGSDENIKITTAHDLLVAQVVLSRRQNGIIRPS